MATQPSSSLIADRERLRDEREQARQRLAQLLLEETRQHSALRPEDLVHLEANLPNLSHAIEQAQERGNRPLLLALADYAWNYVHLQGKWRLALEWAQCACQAAQDERQTDLGVTWLFRRARLHEELGEPQEALAILWQASALVTQPSMQGDILLHLGWLAQTELSDPAAARRHLTGSREAFAQADDQLGQARVQRQLALLDTQEGHVEMAIDTLTALRASLRATLAQEDAGWEGSRVAAAVEHDLADLHLQRRDWRAAEDCLQRAQELAQDTPDRLLQADVELLLARRDAARGRWRSAEEHCQARLAVLQQPVGSGAQRLSADPDVGDRAGQAAALIELGNLSLRRGRRGRSRAATFFEQARQAAGEHDGYNLAVATARLGELAGAEGRPAEATQLLAQALESLRHLGAPLEAATCALALGRLALGGRDLGCADDLVRQALALCAPLPPAPVTVAAHRLRGWIAERRCAWGQAADHYAHGQQAASALGQPEAASLARRAARCRRRALTSRQKEL